MTANSSDMMPFTIAQFVLMGVLAVLVIAGILWGMKLKRQRLAAAEEVEDRRDAADVVPATPEATEDKLVEQPAVVVPPVAAPVVAPEPVAPPPPSAPTPLPIQSPAPVEPTPAETVVPTLAADQPETANVAPPAAELTSKPQPDAPLAGAITQLKGLGPKLATTLAGLGITRVDQIAAMSADELNALDAQLGAFKGRPARDRWAEQARLLTAGDKAAYEAEFGKLGD